MGTPSTPNKNSLPTLRRTAHHAYHAPRLCFVPRQQQRPRLTPKCSTVPCARRCRAFGFEPSLLLVMAATINPTRPPCQSFRGCAWGKAGL